MKQKLALSCAMIHKPDVLLLDEPTTGVDAVSRIEFWEMLKNLQKSGITILVSTPYMDEAGLCDQVGLIQNGEILSIESPENIISNYAWPLYAVSASDMYNLLFDLQRFDHSFSAFRFGEYIHVSMKQGFKDPELLLYYLEEKSYSEITIKPVKPNVEDCFMALMKNPDNES